MSKLPRTLRWTRTAALPYLLTALQKYPPASANDTFYIDISHNITTLDLYVIIFYDHIMSYHSFKQHVLSSNVYRPSITTNENHALLSRDREGAETERGTDRHRHRQTVLLSHRIYTLPCAHKKIVTYVFFYNLNQTAPTMTFSFYTNCPEISSFF